MRFRTRQTGLSLIELLVGLVIGLITVLIIGQSMALFEGDKRTTSGGADAQTNGYAALLAMERDVRAAGSGLVGADNRLTCEGTTYRQYKGTQEPAVASPPNGFLPPVRIVRGGNGAVGDALVIVRSNVRYGSPLPSILANDWAANNCATQGALQPGTANDPDRGEGELFLIAPASHRGRIDDLAAAPPSADLRCYVVQMSAVAAPAGCPADNLSFATANTEPYNNGAVLPGTPAAGDLVIALGANPYIRYGVHEGRLMRSEQLAYINRGSAYADDERLMDDIVYVAAQYGIDTDCVSTVAGDCVGTAPASQSVNRFVNPTGAWAETVLTAAKFARIKAIRLAVVARNPQYNKEPVSPADITLWQPLSLGDDPAPHFAVPGPEQHYRYRVFETVIPLKNMIWGQL